ncbi:hypothetical protein GCM10023092_21150 [Rurimicrobium arvi]|uniref:Uncharacterized protein n=1 Tax=Rurimicrobium arvi TaxID=2049916 RepID=A0ABP8MXU2_9BACT
MYVCMVMADKDNCLSLIAKKALKRGEVYKSVGKMPADHNSVSLVCLPHFFAVRLADVSDQ